MSPPFPVRRATSGESASLGAPARRGHTETERRRSPALFFSELTRPNFRSAERGTDQAGRRERPVVEPRVPSLPTRRGRPMTWIVAKIKWFMLASGLLTCAALYAAIMPQDA